MEALAAISLAGTILQFIDSGSRFVTLAHRLHRGSVEDAAAHRDIERVTESLTEVLSKLGHAGAQEADDGLVRLAKDCQKTADHLLRIMRKLKLKDAAGKRDALKAALRLMFKEEEIEGHRKALSDYRSQLNLQLLVSIREYAVASAEQQHALTQALGVMTQDTAKIGGIAASLLTYLVSRVRGKGEYIDDVRQMQKDLVKTIYNTDNSNEATWTSQIQLTSTDRLQMQDGFLASLEYDDMVDRESRIATAHEATFRWALGDANPQGNVSRRTMKWSNVRDWLESDDQLYWITGKAGSGKSTLMKFLGTSVTPSKTGSDNPAEEDDTEVLEVSRCRPYLEKWTGSSRLIIASFYFWNSGTELQTTQIGLFRTLLHGIIKQRPEILPKLVPKQWQSLCLFDRQPEQWDLGSLVEIFFRAVKLLGTDSKLCLFIDGLDEFEGNHDSLISMVGHLVRDNKHVKVCVASRPWNVFQSAFERAPNLRLEDLTYDDIRNFVQAKLTADAEFENLRDRYPEFADQLMENIVVKASGVFLWVDLVVSSLLAGMRLGDRIEDFQRRLDELPPDLERLYEKILRGLDKFYLSHAAQLFALVDLAGAPLTMLQLAFADEETPQSAISMPVAQLPEDKVSMRVEALRRRLNSRSKGFLEVERGLSGIQGNDTYRPHQLTVQFLHRTVRDFIKSPGAQEYLQSSLDSSFDPSLRLCLAYLMDLKNLKPQLARLRGVVEVFQCMRHAAVAQRNNAGAVLQLMDELNTLAKRSGYTVSLSADLHQKAYRGITNVHERLAPTDIFQSVSHGCQGGTARWGAPMPDWELDGVFLSLASIHGIVPFVKARAEWGGCVSRQGTKNNKPDRWPLLMDAVSGNVPDLEMVSCLLDIGADPHFRLSNVGSQTPWMVALYKTASLQTLKTGFGTPAEYERAERQWMATLQLMHAKAGLDPRLDETQLPPASRQILFSLGISEHQPRVSKGSAKKALSWKFW